jgi:uncharacterized integral membrane protein
MLLLIGPAVAVIGIVAVVFVMRHKSVEKRSMYSARRSQIEHKVRAARQRTLAPTRRAEKADKGHSIEETASAAPMLTYETSAYAGPPVASPPSKAPSGHAQPAWDTGPVTTPVDPPAFTPPAPAYEPSPAYEPPPAPAYEPPPFEAPAAQPEWTPSPPAPLEQERAAPEPVTTSAGAGASWSVVGESKGLAEPERAPKKKGSKDAQSGAWSLASGEVAGEEPDEGPRKPSTLIAIAQYAVLVVGLVMVLIGVVVMVANSHGS